MKITTWNVNGIRSFGSGGVAKLLRELGADVVCLQETKINRESLTAEIAIVPGFSSYFSFCRTKKGYSGVATYCSDCDTPLEAVDHLCFTSDDGNVLGDTTVDDEGRAVITEFCLRKTSEHDSPGSSQTADVKLALFNVYCVNFVPENEKRLDYKLRHHRLLESRANWYRAQGFLVLIVGDFNIAHTELDHCEAYLIPDFRVQPHRLWMNSFLKQGYVDCFRHFHPKEQKAYTVWNTQTGARAINYGTRVDYAIADNSLFEMGIIADCFHVPSQMGSDHCPVVVEFNKDWTVVSSEVLPSLCTKLIPEFRFTQNTLHAYFTYAEKSVKVEDGCTPRKKRKVSAQSSLSFFFSKEKKPVSGTAQPSPSTNGDEKVSTEGSSS